MSATARFMLLVIGGPRFGSFALLRPGEVVRVGRDPGNALCVDDPQVSRRQFEVVWDGSVCRLRDLGSSNGTLVNGRLVSGELTLAADDVVEAGATRFGLRDLARPEAASAEPPREAPSAAPAAPGRAPAAAPEAGPVPGAEPSAPPGAGVPPPPAPAGPLGGARLFAGIEVDPRTRELPAPASDTPTGRLLAALPDAAGRRFAVVEGAGPGGLPEQVARLGYPVYALLPGAGLRQVAPCLVPLEAPPVALLRAWCEGALAGHAVLVESPAPLEEVHAHLASLFVVSDDGGREHFLRYWDPAALGALLPLCSAEELAGLFGPIVRWIVEDARSGGHRGFRLCDGRLVEEEVRAP